MHALTAALLVGFFVLYAAGALRLWRKAGPGRGIGLPQVSLFGIGMLVTAVAVLSPLHHMAERLVWAHMLQHELLMVVAAPLLVMARPVEAWTWALPALWRRSVRWARLLQDPLLAWSLHTAAVWGWHIPGLFEAAVTSEAVHAAQHLSFFLTAALFWWSVLAPRAKPMAAMVSLFATMLQTGALGVLMTFAQRPWYAGSTLEDQQLAGLIMWVPAGLAYPLAALLIGSQWLRRASA